MTEQRILKAICASSGPLGVPTSILTQSLGLGRDTVSAASKRLERKGLCMRERVGMRVYLRPTKVGLALGSSAVEPAQATRENADVIATSPVEVAHPVEADAPFATPATLSLSQAQILAAVARIPGPSATSRLVELTGLSNREVHRQASRLYVRGFLSRQRENRRWLWALTRKAHQLGGPQR